MYSGVCHDVEVGADTLDVLMCGKNEGLSYVEFFCFSFVDLEQVNLNFVRSRFVLACHLVTGFCWFSYTFPDFCSFFSPESSLQPICFGMFWVEFRFIQQHSMTQRQALFVTDPRSNTTWRHGPAWALLNRKDPLETQHVSVLPLPFIHALANYITPFILWLIVFMKFLIYVHIHTGYVFSYFFYNVPLLFFCNPSWLDPDSEPRWSTPSQSWSLKPPISNTWRRTPGFFTRIGWEQTAKRAKHI